MVVYVLSKLTFACCSFSYHSYTLAAWGLAVKSLGILDISGYPDSLDLFFIRVTYMHYVLINMWVQYSL